MVRAFEPKKYYIELSQALQKSSWHKLLKTCGLQAKFWASPSIGLLKKPKLVQFSNFEQFWNAEIILHWNYFKHFFLNVCDL